MRAVMTAAELREHQVDSYGRDYSESDDGYSDMEAEAKRGWHALSCWGEDGWDLGDWPYLVISARTARHQGQDRYELLSVCEGDRTLYRFETATDRDAALDYLFCWYIAGREYPEMVAAGITPQNRAALDAGTLDIPERFRGPYRARAVAS